MRMRRCETQWGEQMTEPYAIRESNRIVAYFEAHSVSSRPSAPDEQDPKGRYRWVEANMDRGDAYKLMLALADLFPEDGRWVHGKPQTSEVPNAK